MRSDVIKLLDLLGQERWRVEPTRKGYYAYYDFEINHKYAGVGYPSLHKTLSQAVQKVYKGLRNSD